MKNAIIIVALMSVTACQQSTAQTDHSVRETFNIAPNTVACEGPFPQRCLIVNGEYFYDSIKGYEHIEGKSAKICVLRSKRPNAELLMDVGSYLYDRVKC